MFAKAISHRIFIIMTVLTGTVYNLPSIGRQHIMTGAMLNSAHPVSGNPWEWASPKFPVQLP